ncbi:polyprenyl synthetase family protein [Nocardia aurantiaca]|uniref:polyprenyl synthetase family protein n=1 Tax=Nocardia aurantiaca TaxID=2675850 RepID=UPI0018AA03B8|nr:polyprenyl synthetase family protein [Nocardia aurantiaca]
MGSETVMTVSAVANSPVDHGAIRRRIDAALHEFLDRKAESAAACRLPADVVGAVRSFLFAGGNRIRSLFCVLGWYAGGGIDLPDEVVRTAAAVELFHSATLIHDDLLDDRDSRDGRPTVHRIAADRSRRVRNGRAAERFGARSAVILGDCGLGWAQELIHGAGLSPARSAAVSAVLDTLRTEVNYGRYLELVTSGRPTPDLDQAWEIVRYRTVACMVERPLHVGAALAAADPDVLRSLTAYARPVGEVARLQDELRSVFQDGESVGRFGLRDLREGRHTVLLALALRHATPERRDDLTGFVGNTRLDESGAAICRDILSVTARFEVERMIRHRRNQIESALDDTRIPDFAVAGLRNAADLIIG